MQMRQVMIEHFGVVSKFIIRDDVLQLHSQKADYLSRLHCIQLPLKASNLTLLTLFLRSS